MESFDCEGMIITTYFECNICY